MRLYDRIGLAAFKRLEARYSELPRGSYTATFDHTVGVLRLVPDATARNGARLTFLGLGGDPK